MIKTRQYAADCIANVISNHEHKTEKQLASALNQKLSENEDLLKCGWYTPPPFGISVLSETKDNLDRLLFDSLRKEQYWPSDTPIYDDSILFIYCSPAHKHNAVFGDIGITLYAGDDNKISNHLHKALNSLKEIATFTEISREFREICAHAQTVFKQNNVNNDRALLLTTDKDEFNLGHTVPFTHELPSIEEQAIIDSGNFEDIRDLISHKRIYLGPEETFKITENCAFTVEARLEDNDDPTCPNNFYHLIVSFRDGQKQIHDMYTPIFDAWKKRKAMNHEQN